MMTWLRDQLTRRPSAASERAAAFRHELDELVDRRERESATTVREEGERRRASGGFLYDGMVPQTVPRRDRP